MLDQSPARTLEVNDETIEQLRQLDNSLAYWLIMLMLDFNALGTDCGNSSLSLGRSFGSLPQRVIELNVCVQRISERTRYRVDQTPSLLDLVITNAIDVQGCSCCRVSARKSDHVVII